MLSAISRRARALTRRVVELAPFPQPPIRATRHPVVLMHGYGALANLSPGGMLHAEAMHLRAHGVAAYAPHVNPYATVATRTAAWADRLRRVFDETGAERVSLVGFSLGGLDARHLAADPAWAGRIAAVVTVATPHRGTPLAAHLLERSDRLAGWATGAMTFVGSAAWEEEPPDVAAALAELTPAYIEGTFNPAHPLPGGVWCASFSARAGAGTYPPLLLPHRILTRLAGDNDGIVPTASAVWAEHLGTLEADHARLVGVGLGRGLDAKAFYLDVAARLRERGL